jgi:hypothetical protein
LTQECVLELLKLSSNVNEREPLPPGAGVAHLEGGRAGRDLHSFTLELNLSDSRTHS